MVFIEKKNIVNHYNCSKFNEGCPNKSYYSNEIYNCEYWFNILKYVQICTVYGNLLVLTINLNGCYCAKMFDSEPSLQSVGSTR